MRAFHSSLLRLLLADSILVLAVVGSRVQAKLIVCVGDSTTYGAGLPKPASDAYPAQLARMLREFDREWEVRNFGVNASNVIRKGPLPYITQGAFNQARACDPDAVVIWLGVNDSVTSVRPYLEDFVTDYLELIDGFASLTNQPVIYLCYPSPVMSWTPWGHSDTVITNAIIPLMNQLPTYRDVKLIDLHTPFMESHSLFQDDGLHFNTEGCRQVAEIVAATIAGMRGTPDFNGDERVDIQDLLLLVEHWGQAEPSLDIAPPPLGDGIVDTNDLEALMRYWGWDIFDPALIAFWKLDESQGSLAEDCAGDHDGMLQGDPVWQPLGGRTGGALQFDGKDDYVTTELALSPGAGPFSVFAWVKEGAPGQVIISQEGNGNWLMIDALGNLVTELKPVRGSSLASQTATGDGQWHRVGLIWDGMFRRLSVGGLEVAADTKPTSLSVLPRAMHIGAGSNLDAGTFWSGLIDDMRIYDQAVEP